VAVLPLFFEGSMAFEDVFSEEDVDLTVCS
jgi:hypothetical protein